MDDFLEYKAFAFRDFLDSEDLRALEEKLFQKKMAFIRDYNDLDRSLVHNSINSCLRDYQRYVDYIANLLNLPSDNAT